MRDGLKVRELAGSLAEDPGGKETIFFYKEKRRFEQAITSNCNSAKKRLVKNQPDENSTVGEQCVCLERVRKTAKEKSSGRAPAEGLALSADRRQSLKRSIFLLLPEY